MFEEVKELLKHSAIYGLGNIASKLIGFLMIPVYTRYLTPSDYGIIELLELTISIIAIFVGMGIGSAVLRYYYDYEEQEDRKEVIGTALLTGLSVSLFAVLGLILFAKHVTYMVFDSYEYTSFFRIMFLSFAFSITIEVPLMYIRAKQQSIRFTAVSLARLILGLSLNIYLIVYLKLGILGVLYSGLITSFIICVYLVWKTFSEIHLRFSLLKLREMIRYGLPLVPSGLAMFVIHFGDRYFLRHYGSLNSVGIYSLGYKFGFMLSFLIGQPFHLIWSAKMYEVIKEKDGEEKYAKILTYYAFILIFAALGMSVLIKDLLKVIATPRFLSAHTIVPIVALGYVFREFREYFRGVLHITKKTSYVGITGVITALVSIGLYYLLIPSFDVQGAGWATVLTFLFMASVTYFVANQFCFMRYEFRRIFLMLLIGVLLFLSSHFISIETIVVSIALRMLIVLMFPFILLVLGFFTREEKERIKLIALRLGKQIKPSFLTH